MRRAAGQNIAEAYRTGRGSFRLRARWSEEPLGHGHYQIVVTEIPYQVQKGKLIERIAELLDAERSCRCSATSATNCAEDVRLVLEPRSRNGRCRRADGAAVPADRTGGPRRRST